VWVRRIQLVDMLVADALVVPVPNRRADEDSTGIKGVKGGAVVREVVLDVPEVSVVETETAELDDDSVVDTETGVLDDDLVVDTETAEIDPESEIGLVSSSTVATLSHGRSSRLLRVWRCFA
jgi:hypothetical protein